MVGKTLCIRTFHSNVKCIQTMTCVNRQERKGMRRTILGTARVRSRLGTGVEENARNLRYKSIYISFFF
jgi:hypothetical protein